MGRTIVCRIQVTVNVGLLRGTTVYSRRAFDSVRLWWSRLPLFASNRVTQSVLDRFTARRCLQPKFTRRTPLWQSITYRARTKTCLCFRRSSVERRRRFRQNDRTSTMVSPGRISVLYDLVRLVYDRLSCRRFPCAMAAAGVNYPLFNYRSHRSLCNCSQLSPHPSRRSDKIHRVLSPPSAHAK